jgi:2-haloacid dehalogenase
MFAIRALVFDAYGTLFDVHSVVAECERRFPGRGAELSRLWRQKQLEYTWLRSLMGRYEDFTRVTADGLAHACAALGLPLDATASRALMECYDHLACYTEVPATLDVLSGFRRAILSNGSPRMLVAVVANAGLVDRFDAVLSVDPLRVYKPHPSVYALACERLGVSAGELGFVSSNFWDISGATAFGFRTFWINRSGAMPDELGQRPHAIVGNLAELPPLLA